MPLQITQDAFERRTRVATAEHGRHRPQPGGAATDQLDVVAQLLQLFAVGIENRQQLRRRLDDGEARQGPVAGSEAQLPTDEVVGLYRERMHIELAFRDWKTHLGVRGLRLEVDAPARLGLLLLALSIAYILAVLLGAGEIAGRVRAYSEVLRSTPRHGTRRRLGALSIGILALSLGRFADLARRELDRLLTAFERGVPAVELIR